MGRNCPCPESLALLVWPGALGGFFPELDGIRPLRDVMEKSGLTPPPDTLRREP